MKYAQQRVLRYKNYDPNFTAKEVARVDLKTSTSAHFSTERKSCFFK
jgi:hypothetical protein